jgi:hypothetical protein
LSVASGTTLPGADEPFAPPCDAAGCAGIGAELNGAGAGCSIAVAAGCGAIGGGIGETDGGGIVPPGRPSPRGLGDEIGGIAGASPDTPGGFRVGPGG